MGKGESGDGLDGVNRWIVDASREGAKLARNEIKMQFRAKSQSRKEVAKKKYNRGSITQRRKARKKKYKKAAIRAVQCVG